MAERSTLNTDTTFVSPHCIFELTERIVGLSSFGVARDSTGPIGLISSSEDVFITADFGGS